MYQKRKNLENILILLLDLLCIFFSGGLAYWWRYHVFFGRYLPEDGKWHILLLCVIFIVAFFVCGFSRHFFRRSWVKEWISVVKADLILVVAWILITFMLHRVDEVSRLVFAYFFIANMFSMYIVHLAFKLYMTKMFKYSRYSSRLLLVTTSSAVEDILHNLVSYNEWNWLLKGIVLLDQSEAVYGTEGDAEQAEPEAACSAEGGTGPEAQGRAQMEYIKGYPVVAGENDWMDYVVHNDIDEVFIAYPDSSHTPKIRNWVQELEDMGTVVDVNIDEFNLFDQGMKELNRVGKYAVVTNTRNIIPLWGIVSKRILDIFGSLVGIALLGVAAVFVAPAIKLESSGPVFFGQTRIGKNGRRFTFYKFRSMYEDAEQRKQELLAQNEMQGLMFKMEEDPRITRVGKFIRRTSIDEMPQFWNVLKGDMSLVGTRPPTEDEFIRYEAKHKCRLSMTPGMTGLWQVSGRSDITDFDEVVRLDMEYIDNWSIWKDIKILFLTVKIVFTGKGSH